MKSQAGTAAQFSWPARGSLAGDAALRSLQVLNAAGTGATSSSTVSTADGTFLHSYPAGTPVPACFNFTTPAGSGGNLVGFVVAANTHQAFADAVGIEVGKVATGIGGAGIPRMEIVAGLGYELDATDNLPGTEYVFWAQNTYQTKAYLRANRPGTK